MESPWGDCCKLPNQDVWLNTPIVFLLKEESGTWYEGRLRHEEASMSVPPRITSFLFKWLQTQIQPVPPNKINPKVWMPLQQINTAYLREAPQNEAAHVGDISFFLENQKWNQLIWGANIPVGSEDGNKIFAVQLSM